MARAYSLDLRQRVVEAIEDGLSSREAARRFAIGIATAGAWHRLWRRTGDVHPGRQGKPQGSKLDAHEQFVLSLVESQKDRACERATTSRCESSSPSMVRRTARSRSGKAHLHR